MNKRLCHRCESALHIESEGALVYCSHCGAPQIFLSEELRAQSEERLRHDAQSEQERSSSRGAASENAVDWRHLIQLSAIVSGVPALLSIALAPLALLVFAWAPVVPAIVLSIYAARSRFGRASLSAGLGARVGATCGALIALALAVLNTIALNVLRFGLHHSDLDTNVNAFLAQVQAQTTAQSGPEAAVVFSWLSIPEFRAGFFLAGFAMMAAVVTILATAGGALSGFLQQRKRVS